MDKLCFYRLNDNEDSDYDCFLATNKECGEIIDTLVQWWGDYSQDFNEKEFEKEYFIKQFEEYTNNYNTAKKIVEQYINECKENDGDLGAITEFIIKFLAKIDIECNEIEFIDSFYY